MAYSEVASITISDAYVGSSNSTNFPTLFRSPVGTVNTVTTAVTQETGDQFQSWMTSIMVNGVVYAFTYLTATTGTLGSSAGTQTGVAYCGTPQLATVANGGYVQHTASLTAGARTYTVPTDLVFSSDNLAASLYSWEIETWNSSTGAIIAWIKIPTLSHTANTVYYVSVGNAAVTTFQGGARGAAWDSSFAAVWHFADGSTLYPVDSTSNANDGTVVGTVTAVAGQVDGALQNISSGNNDVTVADSASLEITSKITFSAWANPTSYNTNGGLIVQKRFATNYTPQEYGFWVVGEKIYIENHAGSDSNSSHTNVPLNQWNYLVASVDETVPLVTFYLNGLADGTEPYNGSIQSGTSPVQISNYGNFNGGVYQFNGDLDEIRIANVARSADWITAEYNNQATPFTFYTMSSFAPPPSSSTNRNFLMLMGAGT